MQNLIHYGEVALKGKNRRFFIQRLKKNIEQATGGQVMVMPGRLVLKDGNSQQLAKVFGIAWYAPVISAKSVMAEIEKTVLQAVAEKIAWEKSFSLKVKRADKKFPLTSVQVAQLLGEKIRKRFNLEVNLDKPHLPIFLEITKDRSFVFFEKKKGLGGLPVGVTGKVLSLFSGGIDSAVASYLLMKRGCQVDFIHFHVFADSQKVKESKIFELVKHLNKYQQRQAKIFLVPYHHFYIGTLGKIADGYDLIIFRRFMFNIAGKIAQKNNYQAIVTGDNLGQVASQTMESIRATYQQFPLPIFSPLIGWDKQEIINLARKIGTYSISIKAYKDCCSIVSRSPIARPKLEKIKQMEQNINLAKIYEQTLSEIKALND